MASETVEKVYAVVERVKDACSLDADSKVYNSAVAALLHNINDRYMVAHKREILVERNLANDHIVSLQDKIDAVSAERDEWQKQALEENAALDVARAELTANDAEIARLKRENFDLNGCLLAEQELAEKRDALIRSLADALNSYLIGECIDCGKRCEGDDVCDHQKNLRALVAKAREVAR